MGGLFYLYRKEISKFIEGHLSIYIVVCVIATVAYYLTPSNIGTIDIAVIKTITVYSLRLGIE